MSGTVKAVLANVDAGLDQSLERLYELLRIKSISTDPAYEDECQRAAGWIVGQLRGYRLCGRGACRAGPSDSLGQDEEEQVGPHLLFYAHYDVQPVDPLNFVAQ